MDEAEFDALYAGYARRLVGVLYGLTGDLGEAHDVAQEAFMRAWQQRRRLAAVDHPEAWVRTVACRLAISRWRKARNAARAWQRHSLPADLPEPDVDHLVLRAALQRLTPVQREAIVLHYLCDLPVAEIAAQTGAPEGTVKVRLMRGRAALLSLLQEQEIEGELHV